MASTSPSALTHPLGRVAERLENGEVIHTLEGEPLESGVRTVAARMARFLYRSGVMPNLTGSEFEPLQAMDEAEGIDSLVIDTSQRTIAALTLKVLLDEECRRFCHELGESVGFPLTFEPSSLLGRFALAHAEDPEIARQGLRLLTPLFIDLHFAHQVLTASADEGNAFLAISLEPSSNEKKGRPHGSRKIALAALLNMHTLLGDGRTPLPSPTEIKPLPRLPLDGFNEDDLPMLALEILEFIFDEKTSFEADGLIRRQPTNEKHTPSKSRAHGKSPLDILSKEYAKPAAALRRQVTEGATFFLTDAWTRNRYPWFNPFAYLPELQRLRTEEPDRFSPRQKELLQRLGSLRWLALDPMNHLRGQSFARDLTAPDTAFVPYATMGDALSVGTARTLVDRMIHPEDPKPIEVDFAEALLQSCDSSGPSGVFSREQLLQAATAAQPSGENPLATMAEVFLDRRPTLTHSEATDILDLLHRFAVPLSRKIKCLFMARFGVPADLITTAEAIRSYRARTYGEFPEGPTLMTSLAHQLEVGIEVLGYEPEQDDLAREIAAHQVVAVSDATGYGYEEWGLPERVIRGFVARLMKGHYPELLDYSVVQISDDEGEASKTELDFFTALLVGSDAAHSPDAPTLQTHERLLKLRSFNPKIILVLRVDMEAHDTTSVMQVVQFLKGHGIKVILNCPETIPWIPSVRTHPLPADEISARVVAGLPGLQALHPAFIDAPYAIRLTEQLAAQPLPPEEDPIALAFDILEEACFSATSRAGGANPAAVAEVTPQDITSAFGRYLGLMEHDELKRIVEKGPEMVRAICRRIIGQNSMVEGVMELVFDHLTGSRPGRGPTSILIPGPTGVGKTYLVEEAARLLGLPSLVLQGGNYSERHHVDTLVGAPPGYVDSDKRGVLVAFLEENPYAIVFIDEIEKAHPSLHRLLMNFFDKGTIQPRNGEPMRFPGVICMAATNAAADVIAGKSKEGDIRAELARAFGRGSGEVPMPEFIARFHLVLAQALEEPDFREAIRVSLQAVELYTGMSAHGFRISEITPEAIELIFQRTKTQCLNRKSGSAGFAATGPSNEAGGTERFINLRAVTNMVQILCRTTVRAVGLQALTGGIPHGSVFRFGVLNGNLHLEAIH